MLTYVKWAFWAIVWAFVAIFLHYTLPQRDTVYITGVEIKLEQFGPNSIFWSSPDAGADAGTGLVERDVRFIDTTQDSGRVMVYRNEDTGFWPPYFKFDSANLQAEARNLLSDRNAPQWVSILHYGWRIPWATAYPNAISVRPVDGPDVFIFPWFNVIFLTFLAALIWGVTVRWWRFKEKRIDPQIASIDAAYDKRRAGVSRWLASWRRK